MRADNQLQTPSRLFEEFTSEPADSCNEDVNKDVNSHKSRWIKWQSVNDRGKNSVTYSRVDKSESTLLGRLFDRLNYWSGNARCTAKIEILNELEKNGIEVTEDIRRSLPDRWKLGNANHLRDSIKTAVKNKENNLTEFCKNKLADPMRKYMWGIANSDITTSGTGITENGKATIEILSEKIKPIFNSHLNFFLDSLLNSLGSAKNPVKDHDIEKIIDNHAKTFVERIFNSLEIKLINDQFQSSYKMAENQIKKQNKLLKQTRQMKPFERINLEKPVKLALAEQARKLFEEKVLDDQTSSIENISDAIGKEEFLRIFELIGNSLKRKILGTA